MPHKPSWLTHRPIRLRHLPNLLAVFVMRDIPPIFHRQLALIRLWFIHDRPLLDLLALPSEEVCAGTDDELEDFVRCDPEARHAVDRFREDEEDIRERRVGRARDGEDEREVWLVWVGGDRAGNLLGEDAVLGADGEFFGGEDEKRMREVVSPGSETLDGRVEGKDCTPRNVVLRAYGELDAILIS
jgi:hypothetical protein